MVDQRRPVVTQADSEAHDAEIALFRKRLSQIAYHLGLHESSVVRELGAAQVDAIRSLGGAFALPRRLWRLLARVRRGPERQGLDDAALSLMVEEAVGEYRERGFAGADAFVSSRFLDMRERARVYMELANRLLARSGRDSSRFGDVALSFDYDPELILWLGLLKYDAGQLAPATEVLSRLPAGHPTTPSQERRIASLRGHARLAMKLPVVPRKARVVAHHPGRTSILILWQGGAKRGFAAGQRKARLARELASRGMQVAFVLPGDASLDSEADAIAASLAGNEAIRFVRMETRVEAHAPDEYLRVAAGELVDLVRSVDASLVHVSGTYRLGLPALIGARTLGVPFVYERVHFPEYAGVERVADWRMSEMFQLEQSLEGLVCGHADIVLVSTRKQAEEVRRRAARGEADVEHLPLPVPVGEARQPAEAVRRDLGLEGGDVVIGCIHEGRSFGGLDDLVKAFSADVSEEGQRRILLVISSGELPERERRLLGCLPDDLVRVADRLDDDGIVAHVGACDYMVFPWKATPESDLEEQTSVLLAMAAGVPLLVSSCYAFSEVVQDGVNARVYAAGNHQALGRCLHDLVGQPAEALRMADAAKVAISREHAWPAYLDRLLAYYRDTIGDSESGQPNEIADSVPRHTAMGRQTIRVAAIMDEFTHSCFAAECELVQLTPGDWHAQITELEPDFLLVESAWQGQGGEWEKQIPQASNELRKVVAYCRRKGIRTAFWNKEDPVHFSLFLGAASLFDTVFTTDIDRIKSYREKLGHNRVYLLPFACQPRVHNPIERYQRIDAFCFAGSYYAKYPERRRDFEQLMEAARSFRPVDIYDRNHGKTDAGLMFPPEYADMIVGTLPVSEIDRAYKGYRYGITVNTVKQSQTMFARRAFELLACNTLTISNFSRGLKLLLGDLVVCGGSAASLSAMLEKRAGNEKDARRFRLAGLRKVMAEHTYAHRMAYLAGKVLGRDTTVPMPPLVVVCGVGTHDDVDRAMKVFDLQSAASKELVLVVAEGFLPAMPARDDVSVIPCHAANGIDPAVKWPNAYLTVLEPGDHYATHYLEDLQLAIGYSGSLVVGKGAHYVLSGDRIRLEDDGAQYRYRDVAWPLRRSLVATGALTGAFLDDLLRPGSRTMVLSGLAVDEFNYCQDGAGSELVDEVDSSISVDQGIDMQALLAISERTSENPDEMPLDALPGFHGAALQKLFTPAAHGDGMMQVSHSLEGVALESRLPAKKHAYAYANRLFKPAELVKDGFVKFQLVTDSGLYVNAVVVYLDTARNKLSHAIVSSDTNQALPVPPATAWIRFGLRVLGPGATTVKALVKGTMAPAMDHIMGRGEAILITKDYPRYDDLYRYGFVHRRIRSYAEAGSHVDVFRFSNSPLQFDEFEGVNVVAGQGEHLRMLVEGGNYESVLVHAMDPLMWEHVKPLLETRRVVVWVHGAEIQPWFRRISNFGSDQAARDMARRASNKRAAMWEDVLRHPHPNLRIVFVSRYLEEEALSDLGVRLPAGQVHVIPNFVDGELFRYEPKPAELRKHILSVRPFASSVYANDLTVEAIRLLSAEPFFEELEFTIVGDGPLFDRTVEPLREYPNVRLEKRFLSQGGIAALHREHGVFLVPSRMDSQGVSRDEAMASGLVPVTSRVAAIPEFVDEACAILAEPEDAAGLAAGIARLWADPELFQRMSANTARHVRRISGKDNTTDKELVLIHGGQPLRALLHAPSPRPLQRIAIYGDVNLNITDGSAIWAASLAEVLAGVPGVAATLYLKAQIAQAHIIAPLLRVRGLRIVEPEEKALAPSAALDAIERDDADERLDAIVLRGMDLCEQAALRPSLHGRLWVYLTDVPQTREQATPEVTQRVSRIVEAAGLVLCQTPQFRDYMEHWIPAAIGKTRLVPPMVPSPGPDRAREHRVGTLNVVYAGKFAPLWGVREMLDGVAKLRAVGHDVTLHVYGDKIHNPADDPGFRGEVARRLGEEDGVVWHGAVERSRLLGELARMDVGWAWRHASLENGTHELSTKLLEYASARVPPIMARNAVNLSVFGEEYPLYADTAEEAVMLLARLESDRALHSAAVEAAVVISRRFDFESVRAFIQSQGMVPAPCGPATSDQRDPLEET